MNVSVVVNGMSQQVGAIIKEFTQEGPITAGIDKFLIHTFFPVFLSQYPMRSLPCILTLSLLASSWSVAENAQCPLPSGLPAGLKATLFAAPPMINYPTFVCAAPNGDLYVSVDKNGSIDKQEGRGFIYKLVDKDGDGVADTKTVFAENVRSARGIELVGGDTIVCLHPPEVTMYRDKDCDGVAEERKDIVTGIGFGFDKRPPDHTSNGVSLGIDGWLYLAIGDFGFMEATGADGRKLQLHAGGVVRIRPDGTDMELFCKGTRNIYEVAVDPWLNLFARDNTNDGGGWDTRLEQYFHGVNLGYPRLFKNFTDESFPVLGIYGGGSGVGGVYVQEKGFGWPAGWDDTLYTCDWGRSKVYRHALKDKGVGFETKQDDFCQLERVTDMKVDALGGAYLASWKGGMFTYKDENVGYIVRVAPEKPVTPLPNVDFAKKAPDELVQDVVNSKSHMRRLHASQELVKRGKLEPINAKLEAAAKDTKMASQARIAALFTLKQLGGTKTNSLLLGLLEDQSIREFALRALGDRPAETKDVPTEAIAKYLTDKNDHIRAQAIIALDRLGRREAAVGILAIAAEDPETALLSTTPATPAWQSGKLRRGKEMEDCLVDIKGAKRIHLVAQDFGDGNSLDHILWLDPMFKGASGEKSLTELPWTEATQGWGKTLVNKNCVGKPMQVKGKVYEKGFGSHAVSVISFDIPKDGNYEHFTASVAMDDEGLNQGPHGTAQFEVYLETVPPRYSGKSEAAESIYTDLSRSLPHIASQALINLGNADAAFAALDKETAQQAASLRVLRNLHSSEVVNGLISRLEITKEPKKLHGLLTALIRLYFKESAWDGGSWGTRPDTTGPYYKREKWAESDKIEGALQTVFNQTSEETKKHISKELGRHSVKIKSMLRAKDVSDPQWLKDQEFLARAMSNMAEMKEGDIGLLEPHVAIERTVAALKADKGDFKKGKNLFITQGCIACHVTGKNDAPKGPNLFDIAQRYSPEEILTSIINPNATVSQGFPTIIATLKNGDVVSGFAMKEGGDELILRNMAALTTAVDMAQIKEKTKEEHVSSMTPGLLNNINPEEAASLILYFQKMSNP
jgi:putative membrane-bound dehydrogenase-like protein